MKIDIVSEELLKPSSPTPPELRNYKISFIDQRIPHTYVPLILYYSYDETSNIQQSDMASRLKRSLSDVLNRFYPLAGRKGGEISIDCNDEGAYYVEAHVDAKLSDITKWPEFEVLDLLIPFKLDANQVIRDEQLAVQVNLFKCGGIAIGICTCHRIADGWSLNTFINAWAATARGEGKLVCPDFNVASLFPARDPQGRKPLDLMSGEKFVTKRFVFNASAIAALKEKVVTSSRNLQPTRVELVSALIWKCGVAQAGLGKNGRSMAFHPVNLRARMVPPFPANSFGNIFQMTIAVADAGETDLACLVGKLRGVIQKIDSNYTSRLLGEDGHDVALNNFREVGKHVIKEEALFFRFGSWCRFPIYEANFGWGKPAWVSSASCPSKNHIFLLDSRDAGGIEAWVAMNEQDMAKFEHDPELQTYASSFQRS